MKLKHFFVLPAVAILSLSMTSCLDDDDNDSTSTQSWSYTNCFNAVQVAGENDWTYTPSPVYNFKMQAFNNGTYKLSLSMSNIRLGNDIAITSFDIPEQNLKTPANATAPWTLDLVDVVPANANASGIVFDYIHLKFLTRVDFTSSTTWKNNYVYELSFSVNGKYKVTVFPTVMTFFGTTRVTNTSTNTIFQTTDTRYAVTYDINKKKATIDLTGAKFLANMPAMNMTFADIDFHNDASSIWLEKDALTPSTVNGGVITPYPNFPITNLTANIIPLGAAGLNFDCAANNMGNFHVHVDLTDLPAGNTTGGGGNTMPN